MSSPPAMPPPAAAPIVTDSSSLQLLMARLVGGDARAFDALVRALNEAGIATGTFDTQFGEDD